MKNRKVLIIVMIVFLVLLAVGITYGVLMFSYTKTGSTNEQLVTGDIYMHYLEKNELVIQNAFSRDSYDPSKYFEFTIDGKNTTTNHDIYYDILLQRGSVPNGKVEANRILDRFLKFRLVSVENNVETEIFNNKSYGDLVNSKRVYVETIPRNTTTEISHMYRLYMWIGNDVIIANTEYDDKDYEITEWNNAFGSVKVNVTGDFEVKTVPQNLNDIMSQSAVLDNIASTNVTSSTGIDFEKISGDTDSDGILDNGEGIYTLASTENDPYPIMYYRGNVTNNNVLFADKCWKIVRTTESGGVKLIYNGEYTEENICNNTGEDTLITVNENGTDVTQVAYSVSKRYNSLAYNGYMYGTVYAINSSGWVNNARFGSSFTWDGTSYHLIDDSVTTPDDTHRYSCNVANEDGTCNSIRYVNYIINNSKYYVTLTGGDDFEQALIKMKTNTRNSNAKAVINNWYRDNMTDYTSRLDDPVWCNNRDQINQNGINYTYNYRNVFQDFTCSDRNDRFTVKNERGNKKLQYPVALLSLDDVLAAGGKTSVSGLESLNYLNNGTSSWSLSPSVSNMNYAFMFVIQNGDAIATGVLGSVFGLRPAISLSLRESITGGTGTVSNPYVVEVNS